MFTAAMEEIFKKLSLQERELNIDGKKLTVVALSYHFISETYGDTAKVVGGGSCNNSPFGGRGLT